MPGAQDRHGLAMKGVSPTSRERGGSGGFFKITAWERDEDGEVLAESSHGCLRISGICVYVRRSKRRKYGGLLTVMRVFTSTTSILDIKSLARGSIHAGISYFPIRTLFNRWRTFLSSKGSLPVSNAKRMTPQLQISVAVPSYFSPFTISGLA